MKTKSIVTGNINVQVRNRTAKSSILHTDVATIMQDILDMTLKWRDEHDGSTVYELGDVVWTDIGVFISVVDNNNGALTDTNFWIPMTYGVAGVAGVAGPAGSPGPQGTQGDKGDPGVAGISAIMGDGTFAIVPAAISSAAPSLVNTVSYITATGAGLYVKLPTHATDNPQPYGKTIIFRNSSSFTIKLTGSVGRNELDTVFPEIVLLPRTFYRATFSINDIYVVEQITNDVKRQNSLAGGASGAWTPLNETEIGTLTIADSSHIYFQLPDLAQPQNWPVNREIILYNTSGSFQAMVKPGGTGHIHSTGNLGSYSDGMYLKTYGKFRFTALDNGNWMADEILEAGTQPKVLVGSFYQSGATVGFSTSRDDIGHTGFQSSDFSIHPNGVGSFDILFPTGAVSGAVYGFANQGGSSSMPGIIDVLKIDNQTIRVFGRDASVGFGSGNNNILWGAQIKIEMY